MSPIAIDVIIPTVDGRELSLARCVAAYEKHTSTPDVNLRLHVFENEPTCGSAWAKGAERFERKGCDYLHFSADDLEPQEGWWQPLVQTISDGYCPCPSVYNPDGTPQSFGGFDHGLNTDPLRDWSKVDWSPIPFMSRPQWFIVRPMPPQLHYWSDVWCSTRLLRKAGVRTLLRMESKFIHHNEEPGRGAGLPQNERAGVDHLVYQQLLESTP